MSYAKRIKVSVTTDSDGDATAYSEMIPYGRIHSITYTKDDFASGVDFAITVEGTTEGVWTEDNVNATKTVAPRLPTHDLIGVASESSSGFPVEDYIVVMNDRLKFVIDEGGSVTSGTFHIVVT